MHNNDLTGTYYAHGVLLEIKVHQGELVGLIPGIPHEYAVRLVPAGVDRFRLIGGPADGAIAIFSADETGQAEGIQVGTFHMPKIAAEQALDLPVTGQLLAPEMGITPEKQAAFERLLEEALSQADGDWIDYDLPYPRHEFVQFVTAREVVIFHGSNNQQIESFIPVRKSFELRDETGRGNLQAVYGTHDGLWAMFFAVVDRDRLRGSIRNGVAYFTNAQGDVLTAYNFSVNHEQLDEKPWREGALYLLPRESFRRLQLTEHAYSNEWACEQEVAPLAKLPVSPEDFPFLDRVAGHDDSELIRLQDISKEIQQAATGAQDGNGRFTIQLQGGVIPEERLREYIALQRVYTPAAKYELTTTRQGPALTVQSPPPAVHQVLRSDYKDLLAGEA